MAAFGAREGGFRWGQRGRGGGGYNNMGEAVFAEGVTALEQERGVGFFVIVILADRAAWNWHFHFLISSFLFLCWHKHNNNNNMSSSSFAFVVGLLLLLQFTGLGIWCGFK